VTTTHDAGRPSPVVRGPARDTTPPGSERSDVAVGETLPRVLTVVGTIIAPTTLVTALLFYFGRLHATGLFRHLRVPSTVFELSLQDYLVRSADGLFVPFTLAAGVILVMVWVTALVIQLVPSGRRRAVTRRLSPIFGLAGLALVVIAVADVSGSRLFASRPEVPGLCLAVGVLMMAAGVRPTLHRVRRSASLLVVEWGAVFLVVAIGLFWSVGEYAIGVGQTRGRQITESLTATADAVVFSERDLGISAPGVLKTACVETDAAYRYRYDGLKLVFQSSGQYLFLPAGWTRSEGSAIVIPRTDSLRLEFTAPGVARPGAC
jgi:hypothetical protein